MRALSHAFNLASCAIGGTMVTASSFALLMSTMPHGGNAGLSSFAFLAGGTALLSAGYLRAFGGKPTSNTPPSGQNLKPQ
jgi:hypothetical protein